MYYKALLSNSVTSVLHLIQPEVWVRTEFLDKMFFEDSAHYLLYSIIYSYSLPVMCKLIYLIKLDCTVFTDTYLFFQGCYCRYSFLMCSTFLSIIEV